MSAPRVTLEELHLLRGLTEDWQLMTLFGGETGADFFRVRDELLSRGLLRDGRNQFGVEPTPAAYSLLWLVGRGVVVPSDGLPDHEAGERVALAQVVQELMVEIREINRELAEGPGAALERRIRTLEDRLSRLDAHYESRLQTAEERIVALEWLRVAELRTDVHELAATVSDRLAALEGEAFP